MTRKKFNKIPTTYDEQITLLKLRGLSIPDEDRMRRYLQQISYYRLSAYFLPYQQVKNKFNDGVVLDQIIDNYRFDRELRLLVFDCIERIEIAIRSQMTHILAHNYNNSHWQDNPDVFVSPFRNKVTGQMVDPYEELQKIIRKNCAANKPEVFIKHYIDTYHTPQNPPSWMCMELLTMGELSRLFVGLKQNRDRQEIANFFGLPHTVFTGWLHTMTYVRNICAHHGRLWNREFAIKPNILLKPKRNWMQPAFNINQRTFYFLSILKYLLIAANPNNHLTSKLDALFLKYPNIPIQFLGIPSGIDGGLLNWKEEPLWS